jgi:serpin B
MVSAVRSLVVCVAPFACAATLGCTSSASPPPAVCGAPQGSTASVRSLAGDDTAFAVALYGPALMAAGAGRNAIVSPYSVSATLTMVDVGAAGDTDAQIRSVLHLPGNGATVAPAYAALACENETDGSSAGNQLLVANSLWGQQGTAFQPAFLSTLSSGYDAPMQPVDFAGSAGAATAAINAWVSKQTQAEIPSLLQPADLDPATRMVVVNAVYFKGVWDTGFDPAHTSPQPFTLADGTQVSVPTMSGSVRFASGSLGGVSVYELPYKGGAMAMDFVVPDGALSDFEASLTPDGLDAALATLGSFSSSEMSLPKFAFTTRHVLTPVLEGLGMTDLFDPLKANLSGISASEPLFVSAIVQQALVEVDEQGTIAAAATQGDVAEGLAENFVAIDHPFLFLIRDTNAGSILFMGRVEDPRSS